LIILYLNTGLGTPTLEHKAKASIIIITTYTRHPPSIVIISYNLQVIIFHPTSS